jgi:peptidoglycan/xylan/chitin deacetylase (PgdA/CDA1 family)
MTEQVFVLFTMDVEPATSQVGVSGPASLEAGARAIWDYHELLAASGYPATYFVHPEVAQSQTDLFHRLRDAGSGLGLHIHTTKFAPAPQPVELGGLSAAQQREILQMGLTLFTESLGYRPELFRPGCFSANDLTYGVLTDLGFVGGSISIPGRIWTDRFCVWSGAYPYAHRAHATFRQRRGKLPFVDIPLSVDLTVPLQDHPLGFSHYPDLRPGGVYSDDELVTHDRQQMLRNILQRMAQDDPPVKTVVIDVHNDRDFLGASQAADHLRSLLASLDPEIESMGWEPVGATFQTVIDQTQTLNL